MKKLIIVACLFLASCSHIAVPVTAKFPDAPVELRQECETLTKLASTAKLSTVVIAVTENYVKYAKCKRQNQAWNEWYDGQKKIFDDATETRKFPWIRIKK